MVYHAGLDRMVVFGGITESGPTNETWVFDPTNRTWMRINSTTGPGPRSGQSMVYDPVGGLIVLFGGTNDARWPNTRSYNDTWVFDLATVEWRRMAPIESPSARYDQGMVYDSASNQIVLFGGHAEEGRSDETWVYDLAGNTWTRLLPATSPPATDVAGQMAYNAGSGKIVLFTGYETWTYDHASVTWSKAMPASQPTYRRTYGALVENPIDGRIVLFGGDSGIHGDAFTAPPFLLHYNDTWLYDVGRDEWTEMHPAQNPGDRAGHAMVYHSPTGKMILFGGELGFCPYLNDEMWSYDLAASSWTTFSHGIIPTAPFGLWGGGGDQTANLRWHAPRDTGTSPIVGYRIYWVATEPFPTAPIHNWSMIEVGNETQYLQSGLLNGLTYAYFVSAVNRDGEGPLSCYAEVTPTARPKAPRTGRRWGGAIELGSPSRRRAVL